MLKECGVEKILEKQSDLNEALAPLELDVVTKILDGSVKINSVDNNHSVETSSKAVGLSFAQSSSNSSVNITANSILLSEYRYTGFDEFLKKLQLVYDTSSKILGEREVSRVGFRKINSILAGPVDSLAQACTMFNPSLFSVVRNGLAATSSVKLFEDTLMLERGKYSCLLKHRLRALPETGKFEFNLDFDLLRNTDLEPSSIFSEILPEMNEQHFDLFMWSVTDDMRKLMEG